MSDSSFVPIDEVVTETGLTRRQVRRDVVNGYLPGHIDHRDRVVILRNGPVSWNAYLNGEWLPAEPGSHKKAQAEKPVTKPVGIVSLNSKAS